MKSKPAASLRYLQPVKITQNTQDDPLHSSYVAYIAFQLQKHMKMSYLSQFMIVIEQFAMRFEVNL